MRKYITLFLQVFLFCVFVSPMVTAAPNIDGFFNYGGEWELVDDGGSDPAYNNVNYDFEDSVGARYDIEGIGLYINDNKLYMGITGDYQFATGWGTNDPNDAYGGHVSPGDFAFSFDGGGTYKLGIDYTVDNTGSVDFTFKWGNINWGNPVSYNTDQPFQVLSSAFSQTITDVGTFAIGTDGAEPGSGDNGTGSQTQYMLEAVVDLTELSDSLAALFDNDSGPGGYDRALMQYTMECGNDILAASHKYDHRTPPGGQVPEPATMLLFGLGLLGVTANGRKKMMLDL